MVTRVEINRYRGEIRSKIEAYIQSLSEEDLKEFPEGCEYTKFTLILAQFRHLHTHMGMIMGFIVAETGLWPRVLGLEVPIPDGEFEMYC